MAPDATTILDNCGFFGAVEGPARKRLESMAVLRRFERGQMVFRQGDGCPGVFIVGDGLARVFKLSPNGKEHTLHLAGPGATFAEVAALGNFPCPAFAEAIEDSTCVLLPTEAFNRALREDHALCLQILTSMAFWVRRLVHQVEDIALRDAMGRVARYLLSVSSPVDDVVELPSLKKHLANHLNLTSETLSRTLRKLSEATLINEATDGQLRLLDREALSVIAEGA